MSFDITKTRLTDYTFVWNGVDFGCTDKHTPDHAPKIQPIQVGSMGAAMLDGRIVEHTIKITSELREINLTNYKALSPWYTSGNLGFLPAGPGIKLSTYAHLLKLHPIDLGSTTTEDINYTYAIPIFSPMTADGVTDNKLIVTVYVLPDPAQFPNLVYGYIGT